MFTELLQASINTGHAVLMKHLVTSLKGVGFTPVKIRLYTDEADFLKMKKSLERKFADTPGVVQNYTVDQYKIVSISGYKDNQPDLVYTYVYAPNINLPENEEFTSVFVGVKMTNKSFNFPSIEVKQEIGDIKMYVHDQSPKCIRYGVIGDWNEEDRRFLTSVDSTEYF